MRKEREEESENERETEEEKERERERESDTPTTEGGRRATTCGSILTQGRRETLRRR